MKPKSIILSSLSLVLVAYLSLSFFQTDAVAVESSSNVYEVKQVAPAVNNKLPDFTWMQDGKEVSFNEITKDKVIFLNVWGTWCPPCRREIPDIIKLVNDLDPKDFIVVGLASERRSPSIAKKQVEAFVKAKGINYINFVSPDKVIAALGGLRAVPTTFITYKDGTISDKIVGGRSYSQFKQYIDKAMNK